MLDLTVLNSLILLGDVLQEPMTAYTDCSLLNKVDGISLHVRLYSRGERIATVNGSNQPSNVGAFFKSTGIFIDEKLAELPTIASLHFGRLTVKVLGVQGSLAILYQEFKDKIPLMLKRYVQMYDPLEVYKLYEAITTDERDSYDDYIRACFRWSSGGTSAGDSVVHDNIAEDMADSSSQDAEEEFTASDNDDNTLNWFDDNNNGKNDEDAEALEEELSF